MTRFTSPRAGLLALALLTTSVLVACSSGTEDGGSAGTATPPTIEAAATLEAQATATSASAPATPALGRPLASSPATAPMEALVIERFELPAGARPHDVAPALDGGVWYTAQGSGHLGWLDPATGETRQIALGAGSRPHGVIVGPDGAPWVTDGGLNAIVLVDPTTDEVTTFPLPLDRPDANLNTATFDLRGRLWFTGQNGVYGRLDPTTGAMEVFDAPRGRGPYGIATTPGGDVYYASLAGSYVGRIDLESGAAEELEPPTPDQGARRVWADSAGRVWVSEWNSGQLSRLDPTTGEWASWRLPGDAPRAYAVYVDSIDDVWVTDFGGDAIVRFDPDSEHFDVLPLPDAGGNVRQLLGRPGEVWAPESAADAIIVVRYPIEG